MALYHVNRPDVVCEGFEDEVVVVNLGSGTYYSLGGTALEVWNRLENGLSTDSIVQGLAAAYQHSRDDIAPDIQRFIDRLIEEKLIIRDDNRQNGITSSSNGHNPEIKTAAALYSPPTLEVYTDMQELLLLDPIHDVDETGWPAARPPQVPGD